eukprot:4749513-Amphidinium_carterae.1
MFDNCKKLVGAVLVLSQLRHSLRMFREGEVMIMVSSNLLQRGIDVPDIKHVMQFEFARSNPKAPKHLKESNT